MAEIINLKQARKAKAREAKQVSAEANRIAFGRTKAEKLATKAEISKAKSLLDGAQRISPDGAPPKP